MQIFAQKHDDVYEQEISDWEDEYDEEPTRENLHPDNWMAHQCGPLWLAVVWYGGWTYYDSSEEFTNRFYTPDDRQLGPTYATKLTSSSLGGSLASPCPGTPAKNLCEQLVSVARNDTPNFRTFKTTFTKFFVAYKEAPRRAKVDDLVLSGQVLLDFSAWLRNEAFDLARDFFDNMTARLGAEKVAPAQELLTMINFGPDWDADSIGRKAMLQGKLDKIEDARKKEEEVANATHEWEREMEA
ncbi:hypothetical protein N0V94_002155 [Neodidymelliopsis sp. IMI 364377]|nr:hypothetical protein N0V94_002155 [Neodidymelliopsis sp. IMI 364377]